MMLTKSKHELVESSHKKICKYSDAHFPFEKRKSKEEMRMLSKKGRYTITQITDLSTAMQKNKHPENNQSRHRGYNPH